MAKEENIEEAPPVYPKEILGSDGPTSDGWWWCRNAGPEFMPGDELCVEVITPSPVSGFAILWRGEPWPLESFANMRWQKAESPFSPNNQHRNTVTLEQYSRNILDQFALFPDMIDSIMAETKQNPAAESLAQRWSDNVSGYQPQLLNVMLLIVLKCAIKWLKENHPEAWMIPAIEEHVGESINPKQGKTGNEHQDKAA
jgi:hypothetical protein